MREERRPKVLLSASNIQMRALAKGLKGAMGPESQPALLLEGAAQGWCCRIAFHAGVKQVKMRWRISAVPLQGVADVLARLSAEQPTNPL